MNGTEITMSNEQMPSEPTEAQEREALVMVAQSHAVALLPAMPHADPNALVESIVQGLVTQVDFLAVLEGITDPARQKSHPFWGLRILRVDNSEISLICVPKVLEPRHPDYVVHLSMWLIAQAYAITPALRVAWAAVNAHVDFFESVTPIGPKPKLSLVGADGNAIKGG